MIHQNLKQSDRGNLLHYLTCFGKVIVKNHHIFRESDITKERIQKILSTGVNVILTTGGIDDLCTKYFVDSGAMAVRRCKKVDLKRIAKATGGKKAHYCYCIYY